MPKLSLRDPIINIHVWNDRIVERESIKCKGAAMTIANAITQLEAMELAETHDFFWLQRHDGRGYDPDNDEFNYCYKCAKSIYDFLIGEGEKPIAKYLDVPNWKDCTKENTEIKIDWGHYGYDTSEFCHLCGCILDIPLTNDGIEYELDHFETLEEIKGPEDKRLFLNVLQQIEDVQSENFPSEFHTDDEVKEANCLYKRALDLLSKVEL